MSVRPRVIDPGLRRVLDRLVQREFKPESRSEGITPRTAGMANELDVGLQGQRLGQLGLVEEFDVRL